MTETMTLRAQDGWLQVPKRELRAVAALVLAIVLPTYLLTANWTVVQTNDSRSAALAG